MGRKGEDGDAPTHDFQKRFNSYVLNIRYLFMFTSSFGGLPVLTSAFQKAVLRLSLWGEIGSELLRLNCKHTIQLIEARVYL